MAEHGGEPWWCGRRYGARGRSGAVWHLWRRRQVAAVGKPGGGSQWRRFSQDGPPAEAADGAFHSWHAHGRQRDAGEPGL
jgi:hypothetical protein